MRLAPNIINGEKPSNIKLPLKLACNYSIVWATCRKT